MSKKENANNQRESTQEKDYRSAVYLGNLYGLHDGYDGSVFSIYGICKTITATPGGVADILIKVE